MTRLFAAAALLPSGLAKGVEIRLENGLIAEVTEGVKPDHAHERHQLLIPAMGNLHSHAFQRAMAGLAERRGLGEDSFWSWRAEMYRFALTMTPDDVEAVAAQLYVEMLEAGFGRVGEFHYLHHDIDGRRYSNIAEMAERIAAASVETGIGLTLMPVLYAHAGFGAQPPIATQRRFINQLDPYANLISASRAIISKVPGGVIGVAPHSLRAATLDEIANSIPLAAGGPIHIHIAEQILEVEDCIASTGARPVQLLLDSLPVDRRWCLIHATHLVPEEVQAIAQTGAVAGLCPITEANLGDGTFPADAFIQLGGGIGVGSDSNIQISVAGELRQLEYSQRLAHRSRNVLSVPGGSTGERLFSLAAVGGARALGVETGIQAGRPADLVSVRAPDYIPSNSILDAMIFSSDVQVDDVWVGGAKQVVAGRHVQSDRIRERFDNTMRRLLAS